MPKLSLAKLERRRYAAGANLRKEGLAASTYKDYIFGMLFPKRYTDAFDAAYVRVTRYSSCLTIPQAEISNAEDS